MWSLYLPHKFATSLESRLAFHWEKRPLLTGKWHLGLHCRSSDDFCHHPNNHGFDFFYGPPLSNMRTLDDDGIKVMFERRAPYLRYLANIAFTGTVASCFVWRKLGRWFGLLLLLPALLYPLWQATFIALIPTLSNAFMKNKEVIEQPINFTNMTQKILRESIGFLKERREDGKPFLFMLSSLQVHQVFHASEAFQGIYRINADCPEIFGQSLYRNEVLN